MSGLNVSDKINVYCAINKNTKFFILFNESVDYIQKILKVPFLMVDIEEHNMLEKIGEIYEENLEYSNEKIKILIKKI